MIRSLGQGARAASDTGGALILVLVLTSLLSALGLALITLIGTERTIAGNVQSGHSVRYAADALAERVVADLERQSDWTAVLSGAVRSAFFAGSLRPQTSWHEVLDLTRLTADLQRQTDTGRPLGPNAPRWTLFASGTFDDLVSGTGRDFPAFLLAWVADDDGDGDGNAGVETNGLLQVRIEARGFGGLRRAVHLVLKRSGADSLVTPGDAASGRASGPVLSSELARNLPDGVGDTAAARGPGVQVLSWRAEP